jgi:hypothetical protein
MWSAVLIVINYIIVIRVTPNITADGRETTSAILIFEILIIRLKKLYFTMTYGPVVKPPVIRGLLVKTAL